MPTRTKAFLLHLGLSILIAMAVMALVFIVWYPSPLSSATGVINIFLLLLAVDVILGPALTLLVYNPEKKTLVMDLTVIALLQLSALAYGLHTVAEGRPAWLVFAADRFELIRVNEIDTRKLEQASTQYSKPSWLGPQWVAAINPGDADELNELIFESVFGGFDLAQRPNLYKPIAEHTDLIRSRIIKLDQLKAFNDSSTVTSILNAHPQANGWLPLKASAEDMTVLLNADTGAVVAIVDLRPWD